MSGSTFPNCLQVAQAARLTGYHKSGAEVAFCCPRHDDEHPSLLINTEKNGWLCGPCGKEGNYWDLAAFLRGCDSNDKAAVTLWLKAHGLLNGNSSKGNGSTAFKATEWKGHPIKETYTYQDADGTPAFDVCRVEYQDNGQRKKEFPVWCRGRWGLKDKQVKMIPYRLPQLLKADDVFVVEGEKDVETLVGLGFTATTNPGGAGKWKPEYSDYFNPNQHITILPDNDQSGRKHVHQVAESLHGKVASLKILELPGLPKKGDVTDWAKGIDAQEAAEQLLSLVKSCKERQPPTTEETNETSQESAPPAALHPVISELNQKYAAVMLGGRFAILNETQDPVFNRPDLTFSSVQDFKNRFGNSYIGEKTLGNFWLKHPKRRQYERVVFAPNQDTPGCYNLWRGFAYEPNPSGICTGYLCHLHDNVACGDEELYQYLLGWLADGVQHPDRRPGTAIVLRGGQGVGKGVFCSEYGRLFGSHFVHVNSHRQLIGNFNAHLKDASLVFADEALWAGDKSHEGTLKFLVTEEALPIEYKGKDVFFVKNFIHLMISSNHDWVVPAGLDERRFLILDVADTHKQDRQYFGEIMRQMENGGRAALLHFLIHYDISGMDLSRLPQTEALRETKIFTMNPVQKFWFDRLTRGSLTQASSEWESFIKCTQLYEEFVAFSEAIGQQRRAAETELGIGLRKLVPLVRHTRRTAGGTRIWGYEFPSLSECRDCFDSITTSKHPWPED